MKLNKRLFLPALMLVWVTPVVGQQAPQAATRKEQLHQQREARQTQLAPYATSSAEERARYWERTRPKILTKGYGGFRALFGGMDDPALFGQVSSGAGLVGGVGYQNGIDRHEFRFRIDARYSTKNYESIEGTAEFPTPRSNSPIQMFVSAAYRDYKEINFFGLGNDSSRDNRTTFRIEDRRIGVGARFVPNRFFFLEGGWNFLNTHIKSGQRKPSVEDIFDPSEFDDLQVLSVADPPEYHIFGGTAGVNLFDSEFPEVGAGFLVSVERYDDLDADLFDFTRITGEFSTEFPLGPRNRRIAFKFRTVHHLPDAGNDVPFYLMETIGGGTTLRGFRPYRWRDRRYLLMNLEYRWEVWTYTDFALFADAGKVFRKAGDFDFSDLKAGAGFGILIRTPFEGRLGRYGRIRLDVARGNEGWRFYIGSGPAFGRRNPLRIP